MNMSLLIYRTQESHQVTMLPEGKQDTGLFLIAAMRPILLIGIMHNLILIYTSEKQQRILHMLLQIMLLPLMAVIQSSIN